VVRYTLEFSALARDDFGSLELDVQQKVLERLKRFLENSDALNPEPLEGNLKGFYKLRVGDYRVVYELHADVMTVRLIRHWRSVYQDAAQEH
jgi:mRNA interferase RelE/StbE